MQLTFCGADQEVTGSCHLLEINKHKILVDCGMFQGSNFNEGKNHDAFPFDPKGINVVLVTHAHLDHVGRLPKLVREGFKGEIFMTKATIELAELVWRDAYHIMKDENEKYGLPILFDNIDIANTVALCQGVDYHDLVEILPGVKTVWRDAGHIFGSAFITVTAENKQITFSGDIGNINEPIVKDTEQLGMPHTLVLESTYGDRLHEDIKTRKGMILDLIKDGVKRGGTIMIPSFSLERTQELLYELNMLVEYDKTLPKIPVFLDSPLAIDAMKVYEKYPEYYDAEATKLRQSGDDFLSFPCLELTYTREESKRINQVPGPKVVIAGAGMMNGGRILHHALRYLSDPASTLLLIGYQAKNTLGRRLYEGASKVKIFNEEVKVKCAIRAVGGLSAHGDQKKLLFWVEKALKKPEQIFCVHGESHAATELAHRLRDNFNIQTFIPEMGETVDI